MVCGPKRVGQRSSSELNSHFIDAVAVQARSEAQDATARRPVHSTEETGGLGTWTHIVTWTRIGTTDTYQLQKEGSVCVLPPQRCNDLRRQVSGLLIVC
jgi:hypothetical protein